MSNALRKQTNRRATGERRRTSRTDLDPILGQTVDGDFEVVKALGGGSHADVFLAKQKSMGDREVALKVLCRPYLNLREGDFQRAVRALLREGALLGRFHSASFIDVYSTGRLPDERPYLAMEYVRGPTLATMIAEFGRVDALTAIELVVELCEGLAELHAAGFVHRDMTPNNVIIAETALGTMSCKMFDFGTVTKIIDKPDRLRAGYDPDHPLGTPAYMSPEQAAAGIVDARSDQFAIGAILYEMLTGKRHIAIDAPGPRPVIEYLRGYGAIPQQPVDGERGMPGALARSVHKALSRDPARRFESMAALADALVATRRKALAVTDIRAPRFLKRFFGVSGAERGDAPSRGERSE